MAEIFVRPVAEVVVDPDTGRPLPKNGASKPNSTFWRRLLKAGAVVQVEEQPEAESAPGQGARKDD